MEDMKALVAVSALGPLGTMEEYLQSGEGVCGEGRGCEGGGEGCEGEGILGGAGHITRWPH